MKPRSLYFLIFILMLAFILRISIAWALQLQYDMRSPDSLEYIQLTESLLHKGGFLHEGQPETLRTPGYPMFLALCRLVGLETDVEIALVQSVISTIKIGLLMWLVYKCFSFPAAAIAGVLLALNPSDLHLTAKILSEPLFSFLLVLAFFCWIQKPFGSSNTNDGVAGFLLGFAALTRPIAMWLFLPVMLFRLCVAPTWKAGLRAIIMIFIGIFLTQGIWMMRNHKIYGEYYFSEITAASLYVYCAQSAIAIAENEKAEPLYEQAWQEWEQASETMKPPQMIDHFTDKALDTISQYPHTLIWIVAQGAYRQIIESGFPTLLERFYFFQYWFDIDSLDTNQLLKHLKAPHSLGEFILFFLILGLRCFETMIVGLIFLLAGCQFIRTIAASTDQQEQKQAVILAAIMLAYLFVLSCTPSANLRFREQYLPLLVFLASPAISTIYTKFIAR